MVQPVPGAGEEVNPQKRLTQCQDRGASLDMARDGEPVESSSVPLFSQIL